MNYDRKAIKATAKDILKDHYSTAIWGMIILMGASLGANYFTNNLFSGDGTLSLILGIVFQFVVSVLMFVLSAGYSLLLINIARGRTFSMADLIFFFKGHTDSVLIIGSIICLVEEVMSIPYYLLSIYGDLDDTISAMLLLALELYLLQILASALTTLFTLPLSMSVYILIDDPEMSGGAAMKKGISLLKGHFMKLLFLQLSFIPLYILGFCTFSIGNLWITPYAEMSQAVFYMDLMGEFQKKQEETKDTAATDENTGYNDYNAEA